MKKRSQKGIKLLIFSVLCSMLVTTGCNNENENPSSLDNERIVEAKQFAYDHNIIVGEVLNSLKLTYVSRSNETSDNQDLKLTIAYEVTRICTSSETRSETDGIDSITAKKMIEFGQTPIHEIRSKMSDKERSIIDRCIKLVSANESVDFLVQDVVRYNLPTIREKALLNFIYTASASENYWEENKMEWTEFVLTHKSQSSSRGFWEEVKQTVSKVNWGQVAFADAYYGWYWTAASGCNPYVAVGGAAVGSILTALNDI